MKLTINGKEYGLVFSMWQMELMEKLSTEYGSGLINNSAVIVYSAVKTWCKYNKVESDLSFEDVQVWIDEKLSGENGSDELNNIVEVMQESYTYKSLVKENEAKAKKKK
jgi:hypothetical protein